MGRPPKLKKAAVKARAAKANDAPPPPPLLLDDWVVTLREVMADVQALALERATHGGGGASQLLHAASLAPALRRLRRVLRTDVGVGRAMAEERWAQFLDELWLAAARVLATPRVSPAVVHAFGALFGAFLGGDAGGAGDEKKGKNKSATAAEDEARSLRELRREFLGRLLGITEAADKHVRLRVCHFLQLVVSRLGTIEDELVPTLRAALVARANDKLSSIRVQSVHALKRLQEPDDPKDEVTAMLVRRMVSDPSKDVRKAAVLSVAITDATYKELLLRIRDTSEDVRHAVFKVFGEQLSLRDVPISDRAHLLDQGLLDRSELVRRACEEMVLTQWLPACRGSPVALLKALDIEQFPTIGSKVSHLVLRHLSDNPRMEDAVPHNALEILAANSEACDAESIFFWREQCFYYQKVDRDLDKLAALLPNISDFCKLVVVACEAGGEMLFIAQQLLALGHLLDFQDEFGRRKLLDCLQKMLRNVETETELIASIMELMARIHAGSSDQEFIQIVAEITSDLYDPLEEEAEGDDKAMDEAEEKTAAGERGLGGLTPEERDAAAHRFEELEQLLETLDVDSQEHADVQCEMLALERLLQDPAVLRRLRCLEVVAQLLKLTASTLRDPIIAGMGRYILPAIESDVPAVREAGMEGLGLLCLLDQTFAEKHVLVFWRALSNEHEERDVKLSCIQALFDILFSFAHLQPKSLVPIKVETSEDSENRLDALDLDTVVFGLAELLSLAEDPDVQSTVVEGFGKLFLLGRVAHVAVLAQLLETYFSPALQRVQVKSEHGFQSRSLQLLSLFFPAFVRASAANCALLEEAGVHLLQKLLAAEDFGDAQTTIDLVACMKYVCHLLSHDEEEQSTKKSKSAPCAHHNRLGLNVCMEILALEHVATNAAVEGTVDTEQVVSRQKALVKALLLVEVAAAEPRSAALFQALLADVAATCFPAQRGLVRSAEALSKRTAASYKEKKGEEEEDDDDMNVRAQDHAWAKQRVAERAAALEAPLVAATKKEAQRRQQKQRLAKMKRRAAGKLSSEEEESDSSSEEEDDEEDDDDDDENDEEGSGKEKKAKRKTTPLPRRELSTRKSKAVAAERMANRALDVKMKIAFESDEEDEDEDDESDDDDEEEESSADE